MAGEIYIADKVTLDATKAQIDAVKTLLGVANPSTADMATVMNALKKIAESGGHGGQLNPFSKEISVMITEQNTFYTALSLTGKGILTKALAKMSVVDAGILKITVDGVVVHSGMYSSNVCGITQEDALSSSGVRIPGTMAYITSSVVSYPFLAGDEQYVVILPFGIPFKTSLLIEVNNTMAAGTTAILTIQGGTYE